MSKPIFDRQYWINQLTNEVGLVGVPYEELDKYMVDSGSVTGRESNPETVRTAKQYIDDQLLIIEASYADFEDTEFIEFSPTPNFDQVNNLLGDVALSLDSVSDTLIYPDAAKGVSQLSYVPQEVQRSNIKCFDVIINDIDCVVMLTVASNPLDENQDWKSLDQINHVKNTTFFIEERDPSTITDFDNVISYYQFVNAIQPFLKPAHDITAYEKINKNMNTVFDGIKLDGF